MRSKIIALKPIDIFLIIGLIGEILFLVILLLRGSIILQWIAMEYNSDWDMLDYFRHIVFAQDLKKVYSNGTSASFPPLAYLFYHLIYRVTCDGNINVSFFELQNEPWQMIVYIVYTIIGVILIYFAVDEFLEKEQLWKRRLTFFVLLFSLPMAMGAIERGNIALYVLALLLFSFLWRDSNNLIKRELSLVLIAIASGIKVYPAVCGGKYLGEKRWKESVRLIIYGIIFFIIPFVFTGGISSFKQYFDILLGMMGGDYFGRVQFFKGLLATINITGALAGVLNVIFAAALILGILFSRSEFRSVFFIASFMALVPGGAYRYTVIYFILPLMVFLNDNKCVVKSWEKYFVSIMFGLIFTILTPLGILQNFTINTALPYTFTVPEAGMYVVIWIFVFVEITAEFLECGKRLFAICRKAIDGKVSHRVLI